MRTCAVEMHFNMSQGPLFTEIYRKNAAAQNHGAHFVRACAVETHVKISQEQLYTDIYRKNAATQNHGADFVRAWAAETHVKISQGPLYTKIYRKNAAVHESRMNPERGHTLCASVGSRNAGQDFTRTTLYGNLQENAAAENHGADFVRAWATETHVKISQEPLYTEIYRKNAAVHESRMNPERGHTLCASVGSRNAWQDFSRATLYGNLQENFWAQSEHPDQAPAFTRTVRTPQRRATVWGIKYELYNQY